MEMASLLKEPQNSLNDFKMARRESAVVCFTPMSCDCLDVSNGVRGLFYAQQASRPPSPTGLCDCCDRLEVGDHPDIHDVCI